MLIARRVVVVVCVLLLVVLPAVVLVDVTAEEEEVKVKKGEWKRWSGRIEGILQQEEGQEEDVKQQIVDAKAQTAVTKDDNPQEENIGARPGADSLEGNCNKTEDSSHVNKGINCTSQLEKQTLGVSDDDQQQLLGNNGGPSDTVAAESQKTHAVTQSEPSSGGEDSFLHRNPTSAGSEAASVTGKKFEGVNADDATKHPGQDDALSKNKEGINSAGESISRSENTKSDDKHKKDSDKITERPPPAQSSGGSNNNEEGLSPQSTKQTSSISYKESATQSNAANVDITAPVRVPFAVLFLFLTFFIVNWCIIVG